MENNQYIDQELATLEQNWIVDSPLSDKNTDLNKIYIRNSIQIALERRKAILEKLETSYLLEVIYENLHIEPQADFILPNFAPQKPSYINSYATNSQKWIGHVTSISESTFEGKLIDLVNPGTYEIGSFEFTEIAQDDLSLIQIGSIFYWNVGYAVINGQVIKQSMVRFQRLSPWHESDFDEASDRAKDLLTKIKWDI